MNETKQRGKEREKLTWKMEFFRNHIFSMICDIITYIRFDRTTYEKKKYDPLFTSSSNMIALIHSFHSHIHIKRVMEYALNILHTHIHQKRYNLNWMWLLYPDQKKRLLRSSLGQIIFQLVKYCIMTIEAIIFRFCIVYQHTTTIQLSHLKDREGERKKKTETEPRKRENEKGKKLSEEETNLIWNTIQCMHTIRTNSHTLSMPVNAITNIFLNAQFIVSFGIGDRRWWRRGNWVRVSAKETEKVSRTEMGDAVEREEGWTPVYRSKQPVQDRQ